MKIKTEARREAILAAAKALFEEVGFEQATMSEITARVGRSKATLYRYFDSKEALFLELVRRSAGEHSGQMMAMLHPCGSLSPEHGFPPEVTELLALLDPNEDVITTLTDFGERVLATFHTPQKVAAWRMMIPAAANHPEVGRLFYENGPCRGMKYLENYFAAVMKAGKLRNADPRVMTAHFIALTEAEVGEPGLFNARPELDAAQIKAVIERAIDVFIRAYGPLLPEH